MNTRHLDRLMNRASVAVMAAFAPKPEAASTVPAFAERIDADGGDAGGDGISDGLSAEEQATFDAMRRGEAGGERESAGEADAGGDDGADAGDDDHGVDDADGGDAGDDDPGTRDAGTERPEAGPAAPAPRRPKTINYGRYERERAATAKQLKEAQDALQAERDRVARLDERTRILAQAIDAQRAAPAAPAAAAEPAVDEDPEPNSEEDPLGHLQWQNRKLSKTVDELRNGVESRAQQQEALSEEQRALGFISQDIERAAQEDATNGEAFVHLRESRYRELGRIFAGIDVYDTEQVKKLTPDEQGKLSTAIQRTFMNEQILVAREAARMGMRPSQIVRGLAMDRGYQPKKAEPAAAAAAPGGKVPAPPAARPTVKDELASIREGVDRSKSLSDAGSAPASATDLSRLADMSDEEFLDVYENMVGTPAGKAKFDRMMGKTPM